MNKRSIVDALARIYLLSDNDFSNNVLDSDVIVESEYDTCIKEFGLYSLMKINLISKII